MTKNQQGFTLLELMISLAIGLLVVSAATAIFLSAQRSLGFQLGMGDVQQNSNFGLAMLTHDLRHANLNTPSNQKINNKRDLCTKQPLCSRHTTKPKKNKEWQ